MTDVTAAQLLEKIRDLAKTTRLSNNALASLFRVSPNTMCRWMNSDTPPRMYGYMIRQISEDIDTLDAVNAKTGLYANLHDMTATPRLEELKAALRRGA